MRGIYEFDEFLTFREGWCCSPSTFQIGDGREVPTSLFFIKQARARSLPHGYQLKRGSHLDFCLQYPLGAAQVRLIKIQCQMDWAQIHAAAQKRKNPL